MKTLAAFRNLTRFLFECRLTLILFAAFWLAYFALGALIAMTGATERQDIMFEHDVGRVLLDITKPSYNHLRTAVHPLYVLIFNPIGAFLVLLTGSYTKSALVINATLGALCVVLARRFFLTAGFSNREAFWYAFLLGSTASHAFFGSLPSTGIMSAVGLILCFQFMLSRPGNLRYFVPISVYIMGITTTNIFHGLITFAASSWGNMPFSRLVRRCVLLSVLVLAIVIPLNILQYVVYPTSRLVFLPSSYEVDAQFIMPQDAREKMHIRAAKLTGHLLLYSYVAPSLYETTEKRIESQPEGYRLGNIRNAEEAAKGGLPYVSFDITPWPGYNLVGWICASLWLLILGTALCRTKQLWLRHRPLLLSIAGVFTFNLLLHLLYGDDFFIYSPHWVFAGIVFVAYGLKELVADYPGFERPISLTTKALTLLVTANSLLMFRELYRLLTG